MLKSKFVWKERENKAYESVGSGLHPEVERLFLERNLGSVDALKDGAKVERTRHDPYEFKDMHIAVNRIKQAIADNESILVYGDYDADGTTATAILIRALRDLGANANFYIPHRFFEGYGPNEDAFLQAVGEGYKLIITVDCGIASVLEAEILKEHNVDLIIIDHHQPKEKIPPAIAIIHPEYDVNYPFNYLAGAGVALKVAEALRDGSLEEDDYMLAMFGTVGDVVDLIDENRSIVKMGLSALQKTTFPGILALLQTADLNQYEIDETTVAFVICPRLNAPGRMDDASIVVEMLLAEDEFMATEYAQQVEELNNERKAITNQITEHAMALAEPKAMTNVKALVLYNPDWHEGVLGIVAARVADKFGKAVVMLTTSDEGAIKGSARAPTGLDILSALIANEELLDKYGGHEGAAGVTLLFDDPSALEVGLNQALADNIAVKEQTVDLQLKIEELDYKLIDDINYLAPFGEGNKKPVIKLSGVKIKNVKRIGGTYQHLKFTIYSSKNSIEAIFFNGADVFIYLTPSTLFDVLGEVEINEWNGNRQLQLRIIDIKCDDMQIIDLRNQKLYAEFAKSLVDGFVVDRVFDSKEMLRAFYRESGSKNVVLKRLAPMSMPKRTHFIRVYQEVKQHAPFSLSPEIVAYFEKNGIPKGMLVFIVKVFVEVKLFEYDDGVLRLKEAHEKVDFKLAPSYVLREAKVSVHEFLELGTVDEILEYMLEGNEFGKTVKMDSIES